MNVVDGVLASMFGEDVSVVPASGFPEVGLDPPSRLGTIGDALLDGFGNHLHFVNLVERMNENVKVVRHEGVGDDDKVVFLGGFVNSVSEGLANAVVGEVFSTVVGGGCVVVRVTWGISKLALKLVWGSHEQIFTTKLLGLGV